MTIQAKLTLPNYNKLKLLGTCTEHVLSSNFTMCFDILILTPHPFFFQVQCISKIQHACKKKIASWTIMPITIKVNSEMVLFDKIFINYWCKHYINNQISPNIHTVLIHQTISTCTIFMMQKKYSLCIIICTQQKILLFRPKGAYGVPLQYERSFRWKLGQFRYLCTSNALPGHVKITVSRDNLFEDSFQQVMIHFLVSSIKIRCSIYSFFEFEIL